MSGAEPRRLGRPRQVDRPAIVAATLQPPTSASNRWSCRELSAQLGVSEATVARVWREYGIAPRPDGQYAFTVQPELSAARVRVVGVCLTRRVRAIALLVDDTVHESEGARLPAAEDAVDGLTDGDGGLTNGHVDGHPEYRPPAAVSRGGDEGRRARVPAAGHRVLPGPRGARRGRQRQPAAAADPERSRMLTSAGVAIHFALDTEKWLNLVDVWFGLMEREGEADDAHPAARVRELLTHGRTIVWVESPFESTFESPLAARAEPNGYPSGYSIVGQRLAGEDRG